MRGKAPEETPARQNRKRRRTEIIEAEGVDLPLPLGDLEPLAKVHPKRKEEAGRVIKRLMLYVNRNTLLSKHGQHNSFTMEPTFAVVVDTDEPELATVKCTLNPHMKRDGVPVYPEIDSDMMAALKGEDREASSLTNYRFSVVPDIRKAVVCLDFHFSE